MKPAKSGYRLGLEVKKQNSITDTRRVVGSGDLECHEAAVSRDNRIGGFSAFVVIEVGKTREFLSGPVKFQLPDIDIAGAADAAKLFALTIRFDGSVQAIREDAFDLIVRTPRLREIPHRTRAQIDAHDRGLANW